MGSQPTSPLSDDSTTVPCHPQPNTGRGRGAIISHKTWTLRNILVSLYIIIFLVSSIFPFPSYLDDLSICLSHYYGNEKNTLIWKHLSISMSPNPTSDFVSSFYIPSLVDLTHSLTSSPPLLSSIWFFPKPFCLICTCWQLYKELSQCYQALVSSEANLRQSHQELSSQLVQKDQVILQLQAQLQQLKQQEQEQIQQLQAQQTTIYLSPNRQTNFKVTSSLILHPLSSQQRGTLHLCVCKDNRICMLIIPCILYLCLFWKDKYIILWCLCQSPVWSACVIVLRYRNGNV